jgi:hypothetical protein
MRFIFKKTKKTDTRKKKKIKSTPPLKLIKILHIRFIFSTYILFFLSKSKKITDRKLLYI